MKNIIVGGMGLLAALAPLHSEGFTINATLNAQETACASPAADCSIITVPSGYEDTVAYSWSWVIQEMTEAQLFEMYESEFIVAQDLQ